MFPRNNRSNNTFRLPILAGLLLLLNLPVMATEEMPDDALDRLRDQLEQAVVQGDLLQAASAQKQIRALSADLPGWMDEQLAAAAAVDDGQLEDLEAFQDMMAEATMLLETGDYENAAGLIEGALLFAQQTFGEDHWTSISAARDLGFAARQLGDAQTAEAYYSQALDLSAMVLGEGHTETQHILELLVELYGAAGDYQEALSLQEMLAANYESTLGGSHILTLRAMQDQVPILEAAGDYETAVEMLAFVCDMYEANFSVYFDATLDCRSYLAGVHRQGGDLEEATRLYQSVVDAIAASTRGISAQGLNSLVQLTDIYREQGAYRQARELLSGIIPIANQIGATDLSYSGKVYLARILEAEGDLDNAQALMEDVIAYGRTAWADVPLQYYNTLLSLGAVYQRQGRFTDAEALFKESLDALLQLAGELHPSTLIAMSNLGNLYEQTGLYDEAEPLLKQTLAGMEDTLGPSHVQTARVRNNLALLHESQGNFREAEPLYLTSYEHLVASFGENHPEAIALQNNLAYLYMMMEDYEPAAAMFADVVDRWSVVLGPEHQDALKGLNNLGRAYRFQGMLNEAEQTILQALTSRQAVLGERHIDSIRSMIDLGVVYLDQGRLGEAEQLLRQALDFAEGAIGDQHPYTFEALNNLARVLEARGDLAGAVELRELGLARRSSFLDRMLWVTGENAREGYIRLHRPELNDYLTLLTKTDDPMRGQKAIAASLQRKGLLLKITSEIEQIAQLSADPRLAAISASLESARQDLASLTLSGPTPETRGRHAEVLYELEQKVNELQGELGRASVRYRSSIAGVNSDELVEAMEEDTALVDYLVYDEGDQPRLLAGVIRKQDGETSFDLVEFADRGEVEQAIINYRTIIQDDLADEVDVHEFGQIAYDLVWSPVEAVIGDIEHVYLIPDGTLNILPFNALMNADEEYLIQTTDLHILTSGRDLLPNDYQLAEGNYVILAGPDYNAEEVVSADALAAAEGRRSAAIKLGIRGVSNGLRGLNFAPLPGAEQEGRIITDQVEQRDQASEVFFGAAAQEKVLTNITETPEILHMATHGFFLEADDTLRKRLLKMQRSSEVQVPPPGDNPLLRSGLAFAGINTNARFLGDIDTVNDGVLTALEVLGLDLSGTRLVVLSACETGLGEIHEGEGVYGLRRSFQEAGVAEVISSLWEVSDAGTQALMTDFYSRVLDGVPARDALRETQLELIESPQWGYPYIWSAFMIVGSYESAGMSIQ